MDAPALVPTPAATPPASPEGVTATRGVDYRFIRDINRAQVLTCIRLSGPLSRAAIARRTHLSRTSVGRLVELLLGEHLVWESTSVIPTSTVGRRGTLVHFHADARMVLGVDIGRSHLTMLMTNMAAEERGFRALPFAAAEGPEQALPRIVAHIQDFLADLHVDWEHLLGIGISLPGPLDRTRRHLVAPPRMPGWDGVDLPKRIAALLPRAVPLFIDKDTNLGALAEYRFGAGRGSDILVYVKVGTGIGAGLVSDGQIYRGHDGSAGEIGHIVMAPDGALCACGHQGCLETVAGAEAIVAAAGHGEADIAEVIAAAHAGDPACLAALAAAGRQIGMALASLVNLINPALILLDGSVSHAEEILLAPIRATITTCGVRAATHDLRVILGALPDRAIALGAVASVLDAVFATPSEPNQSD